MYGYEAAESLPHRQGSAAEREARRCFVERFMVGPPTAPPGSSS